MVLIIKGTTGCRHTDNKGWMAYVPVEMNHGDYIITLAENEIAEPGYGKFNLLDMGWNFVAGCDFREGHEYMHIYRDLLHTLEKGTETGKPFESEKLDVPLIVKPSGFAPVSGKG